MNHPARCAAIYARVSTDKQSQLSTADQIRKCREYAATHGLVVSDDHVYVDEAVSGVGIDRAALGRMMDAAVSAARPFDAVLVDDTSRLTRSTKDALGIFERLNFAGVQLVAVSQGIDSRDDQAQVLLTVHGMVDSLYVKELAKKIHRGLEGLVLRGLHAGGRCFGYTAVPVGEGSSKRLTINEPEAAVVRRIFELSASGVSQKAIAKRLNVECIAPPRSRAYRRPTWCPTAIRAMLKRELYKGEVIWNRSKFEKVPGTNKRRRKMRRETEWQRIQHTELAIVPAELWDRVQRRLHSFDGLHQAQRHPGLLPRSLTSPYLFSGLLKCGVCGGNLIIATGGGTHRHPKYVCSNYFNRGVCGNRLYIRRDQLEERLLGRLQSELLRPEVIDYAVSEFGRQLRTALGNLGGEVEQMRRRKQELERKIQNLVAAIADHGHSSPLLQQLAQHESEMHAITDQLLSTTPGSVEARIGEIREFVEAGITDMRDLLNRDVLLAKAELRKHLDEVRMIPTQGQEAWHYIAEGKWDLLGADSGLDRTRQPSDWRIRMVAGVGFEPTTSGL
jgi:site-specific DNA recombinase